MRTLEVERWSFEVLKAPPSPELCGERSRQFGRVRRASVNYEATLRSVRRRRQVQLCTGFVPDTEGEVMPQLGGEYQRSTLDRQHQAWLLKTGYGLCVHGAHGR